MTPYETWENIMAERCASINRRNLPDEDKKMLKDRAIEPFGLWVERHPANTSGEGEKVPQDSKPSYSPPKGKPASQSQLSYIRSLGGTPTESMTSKEASAMIEKLKGGKN